MLWLWWLGSTALSLVFAYILVFSGWVQGPTDPTSTALIVGWAAITNACAPVLVRLGHA